MPLVHVHPEADQRHGLPGHVHGGTFHTVFSPELSCASRTPAAQDEPPVLHAAPAAALLPFGAGAHLGDHPTIGFFLLTAKDKSVVAGPSVGAAAASRDACPIPGQVVSEFDPFLEHPRSFGSPASASRAPPLHASV